MSFNTEHSVLGYERFLREGLPATAGFFAYHDAAEAYVGDVPRPRKLTLPDHRLQEKQLAEIIYRTFLGKLPPLEQRDLVNWVDYDLLLAEGAQFTKWKPPRPASVKWEFENWPEDVAADRLLQALNTSRGAW